MLEGVLKAYTGGNPLLVKFCFNPWYVGGGVKSFCISEYTPSIGGFNPWYVGGGVKSRSWSWLPPKSHVSILGMLEGVLKGRLRCSEH